MRTNLVCNVLQNFLVLLSVCLSFFSIKLYVHVCLDTVVLIPDASLLKESREGKNIIGCVE